MDQSDAFEAYECLDCGQTVEGLAPARCPDCGGHLDASYEYGGADLSHETLADRRFDGMWRYRELLPLVPERPAGEGATPLVDCPTLAAELGVEATLLKDEGRNPTGSVADRDGALAVAGAAAAGADRVALASTGTGGQAVAAAAARAGLESRVVVPSRTGFVQKAMINVHGGDMRVVEGRLPDAREAYREESGESHGVGAGETPLRHEARTTVAYEVAEQLGWTAPDAVVVPVGHGLSVVGLRKGFVELQTLGLVDRTPRLYATQAEGCAPVVRGLGGELESWDSPDTICGDIEVPAPAAGRRAIQAVEESGGDGVAVPDGDGLEGAVALAAQGVEADPAGGVAAAGAWALAERGAFDETETVVVVNPAAGSKAADVVRSHLMGQGL